MNIAEIKEKIIALKDKIPCPKEKIAALKEKVPCPKEKIAAVKEKAIAVKEKVAAAPKTAKLIAAGVVSFATAAFTIIYLVNKFHGDYDNSKVPTPEQVLGAKK